MAEHDFAGKVCVVTGGTQGLGEATARYFAQHAAAGIVICGRNIERGEAVRGAIEAFGVPTLFIAARLESEPECEAVIAPRRPATTRRPMLA